MQGTKICYKINVRYFSSLNRIIPLTENLTRQAPPGGAVALQFHHPGGEHEPEEQPAEQPEQGEGVGGPVAGGGAGEGGQGHAQPPGLQEERVPAAKGQKEMKGGPKKEKKGCGVQFAAIKDYCITGRANLI